MKLELKYVAGKLPFEVIRAKRKTVKIVISPPDRITVTVPRNMDKTEIIEIVDKKKNWILKKIEYFKQIDYLPVKREFVNGQPYMYLGEDYPLQIEEDATIKKPEVMFHKGKFIMKTNTNDQEVMKKSMEQWYRSKAKEVIQERVEYYQRFFRIEPKEIRVKEQKKRWGSCTYENKLLFNWRCIMATLDALDYIVVHEMSHMVHKDHSKNFWSLVESILPNYKVSKEWLKNNGIKMDM